MTWCWHRRDYGVIWMWYDVTCVWSARCPMNVLSYENYVIYYSCDMSWYGWYGCDMSVLCLLYMWYQGYVLGVIQTCKRSNVTRKWHDMLWGDKLRYGCCVMQVAYSVMFMWYVDVLMRWCDMSVIWVAWSWYGGHNYDVIWLWYAWQWQVIWVWYACDMGVICMWYGCDMHVIWVWYACDMGVICVI